MSSSRLWIKVDGKVEYFPETEEGLHALAAKSLALSDAQLDFTVVDLSDALMAEIFGTAAREQDAPKPPPRDMRGESGGRGD